MEGLIQDYEEKKLFERLIEYYKKLYPGVDISPSEMTLSPSELGDIYYTYPGIEEEATFNEKVERVKRAIPYGYSTPLILLKKGNKLILLDGHRRLKAALDLGSSWKAFVIVVPENLSLGIEKLVKGKAKEVF